MRSRGQIRFATCEFDSVRGELRREGQPVALTPQALALLTYLIDHRHRAVARDELLERVWDGVVVSDGALSTAMYELRAALGDDGRRQQVIRTLRGRGFQLVAALDTVDAAAPAAPAHAPTESPAIAPLIGRRVALSCLERALAGAMCGRAGVIAIEGEAGIGKTSLAQHFAATARGVRVMWGRCYEHAGAPAFWPWTQILREPIAEADPGQLRRLFGARAAALAASVVPELREIVPAGRSQCPSGAEARFQLFDGLATLLRTISATTPLLLVIDDIHCADRQSLLLLEFLAAELARSRVLLVATYRGEDVGEDHPLASTLADLARLAHYEHHLLRGLAPAEVRELLALVGDGEPPPAIVAGIVRRSEGNPLFVKELARQLDGGSALAALTAADTALPHPVEAVIRRHIDRLSAQTQQALGVAAVLGRDFRLDVLARTWDADSAPPSAWLDEAVRAHVVTVAGGMARFAHALFQEALYGRLDPCRRAALHRRAGGAMELVFATPGHPELAAMAHHFGEALAAGGDPGKAVAYSLAAARAASAVLAYEEAVRHYTGALRALDWQGAPDPNAYAEVLLALGEAQDQAGDAKLARDTFERAAAIARRAENPVLLASAAFRYAAARDQVLRVDGNAGEEAVSWRGAALLAEALQALGDREQALRTRVMAALAVAATDRAAGEREGLSRVALDRATRGGDATLLSEVVAARREVLWAPENVAQRLEMATTVTALAQRTGEREWELRGRAWRLTDLLEQGEVAQVRDEMETCDRLAKEIGQLKYRHLVAVLRATLAILDGRFDDAERLADDALGLGRRMRSEMAEAIWLAHLVSVRREQGRLAEVEGLVRDVVAKYPVYVFRCMLTYILGEMERLDEARAQFDLLASGNFDSLHRDRNFLPTLVLLAEVCTRLRDRRRAAVLYDLMLPFADRNVVAAEGVTTLGAAASQLGMLATVGEHWDAAERHFESALALNVRLGALAFLGQIQVNYALMLRARGAPGDRTRCLEMLEQSRRAALRFGSHGLHRRVLHIRDQAGAGMVAAADLR